MAQQQIGKQGTPLTIRAREFIPVPQVFQKTEMADARGMPEVADARDRPQAIRVVHQQAVPVFHAQKPGVPVHSARQPFRIQGQYSGLFLFSLLPERGSPHGQPQQNHGGYGPPQPFAFRMPPAQPRA